MARACSICASPDRASIDQALGSGLSIARTATNFGVSPDALKRHKANHLLPEVREAVKNDVELAHVDPLKEMRSLYLRLRDHLERAENEPDNWQAIRAFHAEARRDLELLAKLMGELDERPQVNVLIADHVAVAIVDALRPHPDACVAVMGVLNELEGIPDV